MLRYTTGHKNQLEKLANQTVEVLLTYSIGGTIILVSFMTFSRLVHYTLS
jgi:hypothetical protein